VGRQQPRTGPLREGKATPGQQRTDLVDCAGNGGPGHSVQLGQRRVRQLQPQVGQGDQLRFTLADASFYEGGPVAATAPSGRSAGGVTAAAAQLPAGTADTVLTAAREA
jgi:hypothetical protein